MTTPLTRTFAVHPSRVDEMHTRVGLLTRQAAKVGAEIYFDTVLRDEVEEDGAVTTWTDLTVTWTPLVLPGGWTVAGVWEIDGAVAASAAPGAPEGVLAMTKARALRGDCDHCGFSRRRNEVVIVTDETQQEVLVVGTTCVKDFLGVSPARLLGWLAWERDFEDFAEEDEEWEGSFHGKPTISPLAVLTVALAVIRRFGYLPKSKAEHRNPTATLVDQFLFGRDESSVALRREVGAPTDEDEATAETILDYFADEERADATNDYLFSLHLLCSQERVPVRRSLGYLSSAPSAYRRETEREEKRRVEKAQAAAVPVNGERIRVEGEVLTLREQESQYGVTLKALVKHDTGWKVWGTMPKNLRGAVNIGDRIRFDAKVEPSRDDATFGWYSRPTRAEIL